MSRHQAPRMVSTLSQQNLRDSLTQTANDSSRLVRFASIGISLLVATFLTVHLLVPDSRASRGIPWRLFGGSFCGRSSGCGPGLAIASQSALNAAMVASAYNETAGVTLRRPKVILFGDSLTERSFEPNGWGALLQHYYVRRVDFISRGFGGFNSRMGRAMVRRVFDELRGPEGPELVTIFFGANDAALLSGPEASQAQHVPLLEYVDNLRAIISELRTGQQAKRLLLITPPPVDHAGRLRLRQERFGAEAEHTPIDRTNEEAGKYAAACVALAQELQLPVLDLHTALNAEAKAKPGLFDRYMTDGLHFTGEGQQAVYLLVKDVLRAAYPEFRPEVLPMHFPPWDQINVTQPEVTFAALSSGKAALS